MNIDFRTIEFEHLLAQNFEDDNDSLLVIIVDIEGKQHELAMTYDQANDLRDMISLGIMSMINLEDYDNVVQLDPDSESPIEFLNE